MSKRADFIPFSRPDIGCEEEKAVISVMRSGWLTTGREAALFEKEFAAYVGCKYALAVNSATAGLHLSLEALKIPEGCLVVTTPYTFAATAEVIRYIGADPLFVDIEEDTYNIDPNLLEKAIHGTKGRVAAILPVHVAGLPCRMDALTALSRKYDLPLVEDAAHGFPVKTKNGFLGSLGDCGVFSFYANKTMTTGEGGMIVTDRKDLAEHMSVMRLHGIDRPVWDRYTSAGHTSAGHSWSYQIVAAGYKYNLTDLAASIGRVQLKRAQSFLKRRRKIAKIYIGELSECDFLTLPQYSDEHAWHLFLIRLKSNMDRGLFIDRLSEQGIGSSVHYRPLHTMPYYRDLYGYRESDYPVSYSNYQSSVSLPIYPSLSEENVQRVVDSIKKIGYALR